jgi:Mg2+/Co2+ transporter CorB
VPHQAESIHDRKHPHSFPLLSLSAFFSASETAFTSLSAIQVKELEKRRPKRGRIVKKLAEKPEILISTLLIGNNLVNIGASAITTEAVISLFGSKALGISSGILTLVILIFSEVTPKRVAIMYNDFIAANTAHVVLVLSFILRQWFGS